MLLDHLKAISIFSDLDESSLRSIEHFIKPKVYRAGECILSHTSNTSAVMALCSGAARVTIHNPQGKEMVIRDIAEGEVFGDWSAIDGEPRSASVFAIRDSAVGLISREDFLTLVTHNPLIAHRQMQELTRQLRGMTKRLTEFVCLKANVRIQGVLLELGTPSPDGLLIQKMASHQEIAARAYTQREVVVREISRLVTIGLLIKRDDGFVIPNPGQLDIMAAEV